MNERGHLQARLLSLPSDAREPALLAFLCARTAAMLQLPAGSGVADTGFVALGFDSLRAVELRDELATAMALELRSTLVFDHPTPRTLARHLLARLEADAEPHRPTGTMPPRGGPIAIVGAACRVPGAANLRRFWQLLDNGACAVVPIPPERMDLGPAPPPTTTTDRTPAGPVASPDGIHARAAGLLDDVDRFDAAFFGISPREAARLDPAQRLLLEVAFHALEHADLPPRALQGQRVGVYVGARSSEYPAVRGPRSPSRGDAFQETGTAMSTAAGRLAYTFGFTGPCYALDTACSGSLVAVHTAVRALRSGECDVALAAGIGTLHDPEVMANLCRARMLSPSDRCRPFDAAADGYVRGEGCGVVVLKRLADAERDGDRVLAVVLGTAVNQDGRSAGLTVPHGPAQVALLRDALADAGVTPDELHFVEAHGTGTQLGDPIEAAALAEVFAGRRERLPIGSCKANVGHLEAAAGITGLLKTMLALQHRRVPRQLHFTTPTPHVAWHEVPLWVPTTTVRLPATGTVRAGVSAFGFSGTNCHVVLASAPPRASVASASERPVGPFLLPLQAADPQALRALAAAHAELLQRQAPPLDVWCRAAARRANLPYRAAFVAGDALAMAAKLRTFAEGTLAAADASGCTHDGSCEERAHARLRGGEAEAGDPAGERRRRLLATGARWVQDDALDLRHASDTAPPPPGESLVELPEYPFQRRRHWLEREPGRSRGDGHPLLGARQRSTLLPQGTASYVAELRPDQPAFLRDHCVDGRVRLPAAAMLEAALAAMLADGGTLPLRIAEASVVRGCRLGETPVATELLLTGAEAGRRFVLSAADRDGGFATICRGSIDGATTPPIPLAKGPSSRRDTAPLPGDWLLARCRELGLGYGPTFRGVVRLWRGDHEASGDVELPEDLDTRSFVLHPALLDACFQLAVAALPDDAPGMLPVGLDELVVFAAGRRRARVHVRVQRDGAGARVDLDLDDADGATFASVRGLRLQQRGRQHPTVWHLAWIPAGDAAEPPRDAGSAAASAEFVGWPELAAEARNLVAAPTADAPLVLLADGGEPVATFAWLLAHVQRVLAEPSARPLVLVTHGAAMLGDLPPGPPPIDAALHGFWRTLTLEAPQLRPRWIDLDARLERTDVALLARQLVDELRRADAENEVVRRGRQRLVPRLRRGLPPDRSTLPSSSFVVQPTHAPRGVTVVPRTRRAPGRGQVELAIEAAGVNWKDLLFVRGLLRPAPNGDDAPTPLGFEACGRVTAVGPDVTSPRLGERVVALGSGCFASHVLVRAAQTFVLPDGVDPVAAAGLPVVFCTVEHALGSLANVQTGETVLVHAAAGGVGLAALQWARARGCRVLATASVDKQPFVRSHGAEVVGDTRRAEFAAAVQAATDGRGVDVVLNTLSGKSLAESLASLRRGGRFVELGKVRVADRGTVLAARPDVQHHQFDLADANVACDVEPNGAANHAGDDLLPDLLARLQRGLADGSYRPVATTVVPFPALPRTLDRLAAGGHVGKFVLQRSEPPGAALRPERSYLLTGAGGTLLPIARAMLAAGARHLTVVSKRPVPDAIRAELRRLGADLQSLVADVADRAELSAALATLRAERPPLGGVVHAAGALADAMVRNLTIEAITTVLRAKLQGTLLLDELLADTPLDFFVVTSSIAGVLGNAGQAAYAAANAFVDAFATWRSARGRPTTAIAFGPWSGPGMTARLHERHRQRLAERGLGLLSPERAAEALVEHRGHGGALLFADVHWAAWRNGTDGGWPQRLAELVPPPVPVASPRRAPDDGHPAAANGSVDTPVDLKARVRMVIARALGLPSPSLLHERVGFREHGMDSLLAVEALGQLERLVGRELPDSLLQDQPDLERLVAHLEQLPRP